MLLLFYLLFTILLVLTILTLIYSLGEQKVVCSILKYKSAMYHLGGVLGSEPSVLRWECNCHSL